VQATVVVVNVVTAPAATPNLAAAMIVTVSPVNSFADGWSGPTMLNWPACSGSATTAAAWESDPSPSIAVRDLAPPAVVALSDAPQRHEGARRQTQG
jgi:hypothetical protein